MMLKRRIQDLTVCFTYNFSCLHPHQRGNKEFRTKYELCEEIQRGGFGIVYKAYRVRDRLPVAVKYVEHKHVRDWTMCENQLIPTEICHLDMCSRISGVVNLVDWFASSKGFMIIMERPEHCLDLFDVLHVYGRLDEEISKWIFVQVVDAVLQMRNDHDLVHRDIKDENVIINMDTGEIKLVDFGAADFLNSAEKKEFQGTRSYCPPEWFKHKKYMPLEATTWSLGVLLYILVTGQIPFKNEIQTCLGRLHFPDYVSDSCSALIRKCLNVTPKRRFTLSEIRQHAWMSGASLHYAGTFHQLLKHRAIKQGTWKKRRNSIGGFEDDGDTSDDSDLECAHRSRFGNNCDPQRSRALVVPQEAIDRAKMIQEQRASASPNLCRTPPSSRPPTVLNTRLEDFDKKSLDKFETARDEVFHTAREAQILQEFVEMYAEPPPRKNSNYRPSLQEIKDRYSNKKMAATQSTDSFIDVFKSVSSEFQSLHTSSVTSSRARQPSIYESVTSSQRYGGSVLDDCSSFSSALYFSAHEEDDEEDEFAKDPVYNSRPKLADLGQYEKSLRSLMMATSFDDALETGDLILDIPPDQVSLHADSLSDDTDTELVDSYIRSDVCSPIEDDTALPPTQSPKPKRSLQSQKTVTRVQKIFSGIRRARSLKVPFRSEKKRKDSADGSSLNAVKRLCSKSYDTLFALSSAMSGKSESLPRLQFSSVKPTASPSMPHIANISVRKSSLKNNSLKATLTPEMSKSKTSEEIGKRSPSVRRRISSIRRRFGSAKPKNSALQAETMRFPLAVFDVCSQQMPMLEATQNDF
ncbi:unnamed protein product [Bursaphelenchus xylophilus]|uniref:Serine/threonine-protein kinase 1 n=1 Tax=Bursaphelenchus xylophilus TaxID=6326 RepID=A0A1I7SR73_BURXY|nr:unnamed protein product [Bursaphelenchus xylophilus]CAG9110928.1 unnamed protein product [Bursaphelenchus xylophilus]